MYENSMIIDVAQYCKWEREYFEVLKEAKFTAVGINLGFLDDDKELQNAFKIWDKLFAENTDLILPVQELHHIDKAKKEGKTGIYFAIQNPKLFKEDLSKISKFKERGVLSAQLILEQNGTLGGSCYEKEERGLSEAGKKAIDALNQAGVLCDISFASHKTALDALAYSKRPLVMGHALPYSFHAHPRNKKDDLLKALSRSGGMIGLTLFPLLLPNENQCSLHDFSQMVADLVDLIGLDAVSIGSDLYEGQNDSALTHITHVKTCELYCETWPKPLHWFDLERGMYVLYENLFSYGFYEDEIKAILGGNWHTFLKNALRAKDV